MAEYCTEVEPGIQLPGRNLLSEAASTCLVEVKREMDEVAETERSLVGCVGKW